VFEWILKKIGKKIIYDLDDAIYLGKTSPINRILKFLKFPSKITKILTMSDHVITCNEFLSEFAARFNKNVSVIPTSVDTEKFVPKIRNADDAHQEITIGWIGSHTTAPYLDEIKDVLRKLSFSYKFTLKIIGAGEYNLRIPSVYVKNLDWRLENEVEEFQSLDIGVYPLPENKWTLGKAGFKAIQYMSVGVPCVASNVGTNKSIIEDGANGYLARTGEEWQEKLSKLISDVELRKRIGKAGRKTIVEKYSILVNAPRFLEIIQSVYKKKE
jgi:glycosyltransferase involved in cell wall biosynthesis